MAPEMEFLKVPDGLKSKPEKLFMTPPIELRWGVSRALANDDGRDWEGDPGAKALDSLLKAMLVVCASDPRRDPEDSLLLSQTSMRL